MDDLIIFIQQALQYDPTSGTFTWRIHRRGTAKAGTIAGRTNNNGYRQIKIMDRLYAAHRLAFVCQLGRWPHAFVDHINGDPLDNRWCNLREATNSQNQANRSRTLSSSGERGVTWHKKCHKWQAAIKIDGKNIYLGLFADKSDAANAYADAARSLYGTFTVLERDA